MPPAPTAIDLFAGAGGASSGLHAAGFRIVGGVEIDPDAAETYRRNHSSALLIEADIRSVRADAFGTLLDDELTLLKSCPPCQGFSSLGAARPDDPRNDLVAETMRFVRTLRPRAVLVENVRGLRVDPRFDRMTHSLRRWGYAVLTEVVDASWFNVPQYRKRLITLAIRGARKSQFPRSLLEVVADEITRDVPSGPAIAGAGPVDGRDPTHRARNLQPLTLKRVRAVPVGGGRLDLPMHDQLMCHRRLATRSATSSYGRINASQPAPTLTTRCTTPSCGRFIHPTEDRGLTLREAALLQTFPRDYDFAGGYDSIERQIGNAVPTQLARALGVAVLRLISIANTAEST